MAIKDFFKNLIDKIRHKKDFEDEDGQNASERIITFKRENRLKEIIVTAVIGVLASLLVLMTVLYFTKAPIATKPENIILDSEHIIFENNNQFINLNTNQLQYISYRVLPSTAKDTSIQLSSENTKVAWAYETNGQIIINATSPGSTEISIYSIANKKLSVRLRVNVSNIISEGIEINYADFYTNADDKNGLMGMNTVRYINFTVLPNPQDASLAPTEKGVTLKTEVLESDRSSNGELTSPIDILPISNDKNRFQLQSKGFCGVIRITPSPIDGGEFYAPYIIIRVVPLPSNIQIFTTPLDSGLRNKADILSGDAFLELPASVNEPVMHDLKRYTDFNYEKDNSGNEFPMDDHREKIYGYFSEDKGLDYSISSLVLPDYINITDKNKIQNGILEIETIPKDITFIAFSILVKSKYNENIRTEVRIKIILPVESMEIDTDGIDSSNSADNPFIIRQNATNTTSIFFKFNDGEFLPTNQNVLSKVFNAYNLNDRINPDPSLKGIVSIENKSGKIDIKLPKEKISGIAHIGIWSGYFYKQSDITSLIYDDAKNMRGFVDLWIRVENSIDLISATFVKNSDSQQHKTRQIFVPVNTETDLISFIYPIPSQASLEGNVRFELYSSNLGLENTLVTLDSETGLLDGLSKDELITIRATENNPNAYTLVTYNIVAFESFSEDDFSWIYNGADITRLDAYFDSRSENALTELEEFLNNALNLSAMYSRLNGLVGFNISDANGKITMNSSSFTFDVSDYTNGFDISFGFKAEDDNLTIQRYLDYYNHKNETTNKYAYMGKREQTLKVFIIALAESISASYGTDFDLNGEIIISSSFYSLTYPSFENLRGEVPDYRIEADFDYTEYARWDALEKKLTLIKPAPQSDMKITMIISIKNGQSIRLSFLLPVAISQ